MAGCGGNGDTTGKTSYNPGSGSEPYKPKSHLTHRAIVSNFEVDVLNMVDATKNRITNFTFSVGSGAAPTYLQTTPDATLTLVNNTGLGTLSSFNNIQEKVGATIQLGEATESFVTSKDNNTGYAAVPAYPNSSWCTSGAIVRFNPTDGSLNTPIPFPDVADLALNPLEKHLLAFTGLNQTITPPPGNGCTGGNLTFSDDAAYWVDISATDLNTNVPPFYTLALSGGVTLSRPIAAFFSTDSTKAYILSCGTECGGTGLPSVTVIDTTSITPPATPATGATLPATVIAQIPVKGARIGMIDTTVTPNILYVAGSSGSLIDAGGYRVQDGWFTAINLGTATTTPPFQLAIQSQTQTGNGVKRWIRQIHGIYWIASLTCGVQSCVTLVDPATSTATVLPIANGNATGISLQAVSGKAGNVGGPNHDDVYTIEGGELFVYDQSGTPVVDTYTTEQGEIGITGQGYDVLYID